MSFLADTTVLELDSGDGHITSRIYLMSLNYTLLAMVDVTAVLWVCLSSKGEGAGNLVFSAVVQSAGEKG